MSSRRWLVLLPLLLIACLVGAPDVDAQRSWPNDVSGRPAPPCTIYDPVANTVAFCSSVTPLPISTGAGGAPGTGTTSGTSTTGFGKAWYPSTITGGGAQGEGMIGIFTDDITVAIFRRSTTCGNCLQVAVSQDGGVTGSFVSTTATLGNSLSAAHRVPTATPRFLVSSIGGPLNILQSTSLLSGWTAVTGLTSPITSWASNVAGTVVLSSDTANQVCKSTNGGVSFGSCVAAANGQLAFAGGTNWILTAGTSILRSTNDGASWGTVLSSASTFISAVCFSPTYAACIVSDNGGSITRSADSGATFPTIVDTGLGSPSTPQLCDYGSGVAAGINLRSAPVGFAAITTDAHSSLNSGVTWFAGSRFGSAWDGTGTPGGSITCRGGRGWVGLNVSGGGAQIFAEYNPVTAPGGTLQSSAGGYSIVAEAQSGIILNTTPVTSGANAAAVVTLTNTPGSRICIREIALISSAASAVVTLTVTDGATVVLNYGTPATGIVPIRFANATLVCSQTNNNLIVNIGAAGGAITTTTSVIADRYPN